MDVTDEGNWIGLEIHCVVENLSNQETKDFRCRRFEASRRYMGYIHTIKLFSRETQQNLLQEKLLFTEASLCYCQRKGLSVIKDDFIRLISHFAILYKNPILLPM